MSDGKHDIKLGEFAATSICGNDITSSCLYVSALAILDAGVLAPIALAMVAGILYLFRKIYAEVVGALPLNGGAYNALLNTTSKQLASLAACLTLLSYMATAVISGLEAMHYAFPDPAHKTKAAVTAPKEAGNDEKPSKPKHEDKKDDHKKDDAHAKSKDGKEAKKKIVWNAHHWTLLISTTLLLLFFAVLSIIGIGESSVVAMGIFTIHIGTLTLLLVCGVLHICFGEGSTEIFKANWAAPLPVGDDGLPRGLLTALFFGFSMSMLGISGFESSSNFVEEQEPGVFSKTLRNMWLAVGFFNPAMAALALALVPLSAVATHQTALLSHLGNVAGGNWLGFLIRIDAVLVLSGAVLTSFVGVIGLVHRMTLDRCLPQFLLATNKRGTYHLIILAFFALTVSVLFITGGDVEALAGVYTISFLSVMVLFGVGNILLKVRRARLPRPEQARWPAVFIAISAVILGLMGNILKKPEYFQIFLFYFVPAILIVTIMLGRISLLRAVLFAVHTSSEYIGGVMTGMRGTLSEKIDDINSQQFVFFTRGDNISNLNEAMLYVRQNEHTKKLKVVTVVTSENEVPENLEVELDFLDRAYPDIQIEFLVQKGKFGPELINQLSAEWDIPKNFMFLGSPGDHFPYGLAELGGVRLIM